MQPTTDGTYQQVGRSEPGQRWRAWRTQVWHDVTGCAGTYAGTPVLRRDRYGRTWHLAEQHTTRWGARRSARRRNN